MKRLNIALLSGIFSLLCLAQADARPLRPNQIPNGKVNGCVNCHVDPQGGGPRNAFGRMVEANFLSEPGRQGIVVRWSELAALDADEDGFTNGQELEGNQVTLPGDPASFPQVAGGGAGPGNGGPGDGDPGDGGLGNGGLGGGLGDGDGPFPDLPPGFQDWLDSGDSGDLNGDGNVNVEDFLVFLDELEDEIPAGIPPQVVDLLLDAFAENPDSPLDLTDLGIELNGAALALLLELAGDDGLLELAELEALVGELPPLPPGPQPPIEDLPVDADYVLEILVQSMQQAFVASLFNDPATVEGQEGVLVISGDIWTFDGYSPDGGLFIDGELVVDKTQLPEVPVIGDLELTGSLEAPMSVDMLVIVDGLSVSATGTIEIAGQVLDVGELLAGEPGEGGGEDPDLPPGPGSIGIPPRLANLLLALYAEDIDLLLDLADINVELSDQALVLLEDAAGEDALLSLEELEELLDELLDELPDIPGPGELLPEVAERLLELYDEDIDLLLDLVDVNVELSDQALALLENAAGGDGLLSLEELEELLGELLPRPGIGPGREELRELLVDLREAFVEDPFSHFDVSSLEGEVAEETLARLQEVSNDGFLSLLELNGFLQGMPAELVELLEDLREELAEDDGPFDVLSLEGQVAEEVLEWLMKISGDGFLSLSELEEFAGTGTLPSGPGPGVPPAIMEFLKGLREAFADDPDSEFDISSLEGEVPEEMLERLRNIAGDGFLSLLELNGYLEALPPDLVSYLEDLRGLFADNPLTNFDISSLEGQVDGETLAYLLDISDDGLLDVEEFEEFLDNLLPGRDPGSRPGPGGLLPEVAELLLALYDEDIDLLLDLVDIEVELSDEALAMLEDAAGGDGLLALEELEALLGDRPGPGHGLPPELLEILLVLRDELLDLELDVIELIDLPVELPDEVLAFLEQELADEDGLLFLDDLEALLGELPGPGPGRNIVVDFFEGILEGIDLEERLLFIDDEEYEVGENIKLEDDRGRRIAVAKLIDLAGSFPLVGVGLDEDGQIVELIVFTIFDEFDDEGEPSEGDQFFGPVSQIDASQIVLAGPRFTVNARTKFTAANGDPIAIADLESGADVAVTVGAPDPESGSFDPAAVRVQVVDPRRPPPPRADIIAGPLVQVVGADGEDPHVELAGPRAAIDADTQFFTDDEEPVALERGDIAPGDFVFIVTRPPDFGRKLPVAVEVALIDAEGALPPTGDEDPFARPDEEERLEGFVLDVDAEEGFLALEGEILALAEEVRIFGLRKGQISLDRLESGDLLEIDTRPLPRGGFVVTAIRQIDPALQVQPRSGVIIGSLDDIDDGELILTGPFFKVARDADIRGEGGRAIALDDLEDGDFVRLAISPPRPERGEILPVAFEIRVVPPPEEFDPGELEGELRVVATFPEDGDVEIPTRTQVEVTFNAPVYDVFFDPDFEFVLFPEPEKFSELEISPDGRTLSAEVKLDKDKVYQLVVITSATGLHSVHFSTGESISAASITGILERPSELPDHARFVPDESYAVLLEVTDVDLSTLDEESIESLIVAGTPLNGREFTFQNVTPGSYLLAAFVGFDLGRGEFIALEAVLDEPVEVGADEQVEVLLSLELAPALEVASISPMDRAAAVDLETELVIGFNQPAFLSEEDIFIFPFPEDVGDLEVDEDGMVYTLPLALAEDTIYRVVVEHAEDEEGGMLVEPGTTTFTTGEDFGLMRSVSGRLILPELPGAHSFETPIFVGLVRLTDIDIDDFRFESFDEEDITASTIAFGPEFVIEDVPTGRYMAVAFTRVEVPRGFRPPDPRVRPLEEFDVQGDRFGDQVLEVFDTIELFGYYTDERLIVPAAVAPGDEGIDIFLAGEAKTRKQILSIDGVEINGVPISLKDVEELPVVEAGAAEIRVQLSKALRFDRGLAAVEAALNGRFLRRPTVENNARTIVFEVTLEDDRIYGFSVFDAEGADGSRLERPLDIVFSTGLQDVAFGSVAGSVSLTTLSETDEVLTGDDADLIDAATVFLFEEDEEEDLALVGVTEVDEAGGFLLDDVLPGTYQVFAELNTASGQEINAILDIDADGEPDLLEVGDGEAVTGIDISAVVVVATTEDTTTGTKSKGTPSGGNEQAVLSIDLDSSTGNQNVTTLSDVKVDDEVSFDVFVAGASNLSGVAALVQYDADILEFVEAVDRFTGQTNLLRAAGGTAMYLSALLREPELEYGGAILGATEATAPDGDGFLMRLKFKVKSEFEGAQIALNQITLKSTKGQDVLAPNLTAKLAPQVFEEQKKGVVSFDFDTDTRGDQETFHKGFITADSQVDVDVYLNLDKIDSDFQDLANYSVTVEFDSKQLTYISYSPQTSAEGNLLASGGGTVPQLPAIAESEKVTFGSAILGPTAATAPDSSGLLGRLTFATTNQFTETDLLVTGYAYKSVSGTQQEVSAVIIARMSSGEITPISTGDGGTGDTGGGTAIEKSDFDGDGAVGFGDFFLFADVFGTQATGNAVAYDLDGNGAVDFGDFFLFADVFGKSTGKLAAVDRLPAVEGGLALATRSAEQDLVLELRTGDRALRGYGALVEYDPAAFRFIEVSDAGSALRGNGESLLLTEETAGQLLVLGSGTGGADAVEGLLAELRFAPVTPEAVGIFRVREATVRQANGGLEQVRGLAPVEGRWVPTVFALHTNYPNPFNPSTTIRYQLPQSAEVRLEIFDVLGQKVRTLVAETQPAGFHRMVWDSRNQTGNPVAAGVYLYRLRAGDFEQVRKLLLLK